MDSTAAVAERVTRADGRAYVARKAPEFVPVQDEDCVAVLVLRTHDRDRYRPGAELAWDLYGVGPLPAAEMVWVRKVPWSPSGGSGFSYQQVESVVRGAVPALRFAREVTTRTRRLEN